MRSDPVSHQLTQSPPSPHAIAAGYWDVNPRDHAAVRRVDAQDEVVRVVRDPERAEAPGHPVEHVLARSAFVRLVAVDDPAFGGLDTNELATGGEPDVAAVRQVPGGVAAEGRADVPEHAAVARVDLDEWNGFRLQTQKWPFPVTASTGCGISVVEMWETSEPSLAERTATPGGRDSSDPEPPRVSAIAVAAAAAASTPAAPTVISFQLRRRRSSLLAPAGGSRAGSC